MNFLQIYFKDLMNFYKNLIYDFFQYILIFDLLTLMVFLPISESQILLNEYKYVRIHFYNGEIVINKIKNITLKNFNYCGLKADDIHIDINNNEDIGSISNIIGYSGFGKT